MGVDWNPDSPDVAGLQYLLTDGHWAGVARSPIRALRFDSTQVATITDAQFKIRDTGLTGPQFLALLEIMADGDAVVDPATNPVKTLICRPNEDIGSISDISTTEWNGTIDSTITNLWDRINDPVVWPPPSGFVNDAINQESTTNSRYCFHVETGALPSTARILRVRSRAVGYARTLGGDTYSSRPMGFRLVWVPTEDIYTPPGGSGFTITGYTTLCEFDYGEINPRTALPWTVADMAAFDSGGNWGCRITSYRAAGGSIPALISYELLIDYLETENRVAVGGWTRPAVQGNALVTTDALIKLPAGTASWSKPASGRFLAGLRVAYDTLTWPNAPATPNTRWLAAAQLIDTADLIEAPPGSGFEGERIALDNLGLYRTLEGQRDRIPKLLLRATGVVDTDSQVYARDIDKAFAGVAQITGTQTVGQRFNAPATDDYLGVTFPVKWVDNGTGTAGVLRATIHRVSDNVQMGGTFEITSAQLLALPDIESGEVNLRVVTGFLSAPASLVSGTQYELRLTDAGQGRWDIPIADCEGAGAAGFGGTAGCLVFSGGGTPTTVTTQDLPAFLTVQPDPTVNNIATALQQPTRLGGNCFCEAPYYEVVRVTWQQPALSTFDRMTLERYVDFGRADDGWELVGTFPQNIDTWVDREVPRGFPVMYRTRNYIAGGAFSDFGETGWATPQAYGCELVITSNAAPELTVVYNHEPHVDFDMLDFDRDVLVPVDGADYYIALLETEDRGIATALRVIANFQRRPCDDRGRPIGMHTIFRPIRDAARWPGIPYVCVLDSEGNRTFAHLSLGRASREMPGFRYHVPMTMTPIATRATPVDLR